MNATKLSPTVASDFVLLVYPDTAAGQFPVPNSHNYNPQETLIKFPLEL